MADISWAQLTFQGARIASEGGPHRVHGLDEKAVSPTVIPPLPQVGGAGRSLSPLMSTICEGSRQVSSG
jgi:hypothetical protein